MAASGNAEPSPEITTPLKIPKTEVPSPESEDLSDSIHYHSNPSTPNRFSPSNVGSGTSGRAAASSSSNSFTACRGMSWTPSETNALIAVWGNERSTEARMQQSEVAGTVFSGKPPGPAMYERVSRASLDSGYERTPSQCRERMKTLRRCYSRVKEHGIGKRKSSYTLEQSEKVFGQGGWDSQSCAPVSINSSGLYQEMESDGSTMEDFSQEDWCNQVSDSAFQEGDMDTEDIQVPKRASQFQAELSESNQKQETMQTVIRISESVQSNWEHFQTWTEFSRSHSSNKSAIFGVGYNTRWRDDIRYHYAEISSQVPSGKRLREYFNPEKPEGRVIMTKVQKMNWKNVYYKFSDITISEARCSELHMEVDWIPVSRSHVMSSSKVSAHYLLPGYIPKTHGSYAIGYETPSACNDAAHTPPQAEREEGSGAPHGERENGSERCDGGAGSEVRTGPTVTYCYSGIAEDRTIQQCLFQHFQGAGKHYAYEEPSSVTRFSQGNCSSGRTAQDNKRSDEPPQCCAVYVKFIEVESDFLSAGSSVECSETAVGYTLKFNSKDPV